MSEGPWTSGSDMGEAVNVVWVEGSDALCRDADGGLRRVGVELLTDVAPGDWLLVHADVALALLEEAQAT